MMRSNKGTYEIKNSVCKTDNETSTKQTPMSRAQWKSGNERLEMLIGSAAEWRRRGYKREGHTAQDVRESGGARVRFFCFSLAGGLAALVRYVLSWELAGHVLQPVRTSRNWSGACQKLLCLVNLSIFVPCLLLTFYNFLLEISC